MAGFCQARLNHRPAPSIAPAQASDIFSLAHVLVPLAMPDAATWAYVLVSVCVLICAYVPLSRCLAHLGILPSAPRTSHSQGVRALRTAGLLRKIRVGGVPYYAVALAPVPSDAPPVRCTNVEDPRAFLHDVATILLAMHSSNIVHGNLHIDVIYLVNGVAIISGLEHCGIGRVQSAQNERGDPPPGHVWSMAPELIASGTRTAQTDVYAFGKLMFRMYTGEYPFANHPTSSLFIRPGLVQLASGKPPRREEIQHPDFTEELWALMIECCAREPSDRPTMEDVRARLSAQMV